MKNSLSISLTLHALRLPFDFSLLTFHFSLLTFYAFPLTFSNDDFPITDVGHS